MQAFKSILSAHEQGLFIHLYLHAPQGKQTVLYVYENLDTKVNIVSKSIYSGAVQPWLLHPEKYRQVSPKSVLHILEEDLYFTKKLYSSVQHSDKKNSLTAKQG